MHQTRSRIHSPQIMSLLWTHKRGRRTRALTHCGLAVLLSKLLTATPAILTIWECPGIHRTNREYSFPESQKLRAPPGGEQVIMSLRAIRRLAARVAAGALLATPVVVTFADTVGSVGTVTGCSMRVCVTKQTLLEER